jgi:ABC-type Co2+ transport system permease subunit
VNMHIPAGFIMPLYIVSFLILMFQYYRVNPDRRVLNLRFLMMLGAFVLMMCTVSSRSPIMSQIFLALAVLWLGAALFMHRSIPPPRT